MLIYNLKKQRGEPLYELLYVAIKNDILSGRLKAGDRLPSKREMAEENRISLTTVVNAYQQLMMEGYIFSYEKRGYFVANISSMAAAESPVQSKEKYYEEIQWFADLRSNNILYHNFPYATWKKVVREILSEYEEELVVRGNPFGLMELREEIADYLYRVRGINVPPECVIIGAGIEYLYARLITLFPQGSIYAVENPGYQKIAEIYRAYHLRWKSVEMDAYGLNMADLRVKDATIAHVSPEHHYPLGTLMPVSRRQELLEWAEEYDERYIIEDDFDCEFRYNSRMVPALKSFDRSGKVIYMNTFSKTLSPAVRVSYMVLPEKLLEKYISSTHFFTNSTSSLEQYAVARFIEKGYFERHLTRIRKLYRQQGERLNRILLENREIPVREISEGASGTHLLVRLRTELPDEVVKRQAASRGVNLNCLSDFCFEGARRYDHTLILNFSDLDEKTQVEAVRRIGEIFR